MLSFEKLSFPHTFGCVRVRVRESSLGDALHLLRCCRATPACVCVLACAAFVVVVGEGLLP